MKEHKNDLSVTSMRALLARRRALAGQLGEVEELLVGSLVEQTRRCGKVGCRCADGEGHGPYSYFAPRVAGHGRSKYVPSGLVEAVRRYLRRGEVVEQVLAEISAINAELLARRELG